MLPFGQLLQVAFPQLYDDVAFPIPLLVAFGGQRRAIYQHLDKVLKRRIGAEGEGAAFALFPSGIAALYDARRHLFGYCILRGELRFAVRVRKVLITGGAVPAFHPAIGRRCGGYRLQLFQGGVAGGVGLAVFGAAQDAACPLGAIGGAAVALPVLLVGAAAGRAAAGMGPIPIGAPGAPPVDDAGIRLILAVIRPDDHNDPVFGPPGGDGHIPGRHGGGNGLIPAGKGIACFGRVGRGGDGSTIILGNGSDLAAASGIKGDGVPVDLPLCRQGQFFGHRCLKVPFAFAVVPADEGMPLFGGVGRTGGRGVGTNLGCYFASTLRLEGDRIGPDDLPVKGAAGNFSRCFFW